MNKSTKIAIISGIVVAVVISTLAVTVHLSYLHGTIPPYSTQSFWDGISFVVGIGGTIFGTILTVMTRSNRDWHNRMRSGYN